MPLMRGMKPFRPESIQLRFSDYLNRAKLPVVPKVFGHVTNTPPLMQGATKREWGMLGNDSAGDCVIAGACHETMLFAMATGRPVPLFTTASALGEYSKATLVENDIAYDPHDASTDTGLDVEATAKWRRDVGLTDANGVVHKITAYTLIDNLDDLLLCIYITGACGVALSLPANAEQQFLHHHVWDDLTSPPSGGHYVVGMGRNPVGNVVLNTWNDLQGATDQWLDKNMSGAVAYLSPEYVKNGVSPEAILWGDLRADLDDIASREASA